MVSYVIVQAPFIAFTVLLNSFQHPFRRPKTHAPGL
jgi:hypothetical protein